MNFALVVFAVASLALQSYGQCIPAPLIAAPSTIAYAPDTVASTLADTLSLLTVSSLLAEKLPYGLPIAVPAAAYPACGCSYPSCGCSYPYGPYYL